jgi:hypothetical protein
MQVFNSEKEAIANLKTTVKNRLIREDCYTVSPAGDGKYKIHEKKRCKTCKSFPCMLKMPCDMALHGICDKHHTI